MHELVEFNVPLDTM